MPRVVVWHKYYGCDTGCCGHAVSVIPDGHDPADRVAAEDQEDGFTFSHPYKEDPVAFARDLVTSQLGEEHVADLDWDHCMVMEDC